MKLTPHPNQYVRQPQLLQCCDSSYRKPNMMQQCIKILLFLVLNEAQRVSGDTPPIIRSLKLHKQPLVLHNTWKVVGRAVVGRCHVRALPDKVQQLNVRQPSSYAEPETVYAVLGS
jgi:hypothetical protein